MPIYIYYLKSVPVFCFIGKLYIEIYLFMEREREIHLRPGRGLNSRPLKPIVIAVSGHRANHSSIQTRQLLCFR